MLGLCLLVRLVRLRDLLLGLLLLGCMFLRLFLIIICQRYGLARLGHFMLSLGQRLLRSCIGFGSGCHRLCSLGVLLYIFGLLHLCLGLIVLSCCILQVLSVDLVDCGLLSLSHVLYSFLNS